ncbi:hypothetical protein GQ44DRAFT_719124 [Phaeosphaeriaceae sp. PMI808]|nr:hypothetical protein GQ44DRAFT_719124 [Phaeosphaeriaceae sp. PMI808]
MMLTPPRPNQCAFGAACKSLLGRKMDGQHFCSWFKNFNIAALRVMASKHSSSRSLHNTTDDWEEGNQHQVENGTSR